MVTEVNKGEKLSRLRVTPRRVTATETTENEMQTIQRMSRTIINIINVIITKYVNISLGVKNIGVIVIITTLKELS